jgi:hypothetical protein
MTPRDALDNPVTNRARQRIGSALSRAAITLAKLNSRKDSLLSRKRIESG